MSLDLNKIVESLASDKVAHINLSLIQANHSTQHWQERYMSLKGINTVTEAANINLNERIQTLLDERGRDLEIRAQLIRELVELRKNNEINPNGV